MIKLEKKDLIVEIVEEQEGKIYFLTFLEEEEDAEREDQPKLKILFTK